MILTCKGAGVQELKSWYVLKCENIWCGGISYNSLGLFWAFKNSGSAGKNPKQVLVQKKLKVAESAKDFGPKT